MDDQTERIAMVGLVASIGGLLLWSIAGQRSSTRGGRPDRVPGASGIQGAALDLTPGMMTPDHLVWWQAGPVPRHYVPHRVRYPLAPGTEIQRLIYGAPGACNVTTPASQRGWLFAPPSEADF